MGALEDAAQTQMDNIGTRTGRPFAEWVELVRGSGLAKHGQMVTWLKTEHGFGHGDANLVASIARSEPTAAPTPSDPADAWYTGKKAANRPDHDALVAWIGTLGGDIEHAPKKTYLSLRRAKQFATVGPGPRGTLQIGVNLKGEPGDDLFVAQGPGKMCTHQARVASLDEARDAIEAWVRRAYDAAG